MDPYDIYDIYDIKGLKRTTTEKVRKFEWFEKDDLENNVNVKQLRIFNSMLVDGHVGEKWKHTSFSMIPKTGDPTNPGNRRPLAILNITYKILTRMVYKRVKPILEAQQSKGQIKFRSSVGVDDAVAVFEKMCVRNLWNGLSRCGVPVWICGKLLIVLNTMHCFML